MKDSGPFSWLVISFRYSVVKPVYKMLNTYQYLYWLNFQKFLEKWFTFHSLDT